MLVVDLLGDALELAEPFRGVRVAGFLGGLQLGGEGLYGACDFLELVLKLLELLVDRLCIHAGDHRTERRSRALSGWARPLRPSIGSCSSRA